MADVQRPEPTKLSPVAEQQLELNRQLSKRLPTATREEITELQQHLQAAPEGTTIAAVEPIKPVEPVEPGETVAPAEATPPVIPRR